MKTKIIAMTLASISVVALANPAQDLLLAMNESSRQKAMSGLLSASGEKCPVSSRTFYQGSDNRGNAFWNVACSGGHAFVVQVMNDSKGSTKILDCAILKAMNAGTCFTKFK